MFITTRRVAWPHQALVLFTLSSSFLRAQLSLPNDDAHLPGSEPPSTAPIPRRAPAKPPRVSYQNGQLTIIADNSTMSSVFAAIRECIGVEIQTPKTFDDDRSFVTLGPGPAREVLSDFLSETDFNYVIQSSTSDARQIEWIQLTARVKEGPDRKNLSEVGNLTMTPARRLWLASRSAERPATDLPTDATPPSETESVAQPRDNPKSSTNPAEDASTVATGTPPSPDTKEAAGDQSQNEPHENNLGTTPLSSTPPAPDAASTTDGTVQAPPPSSESPDSTQSAPSVLQKQINQMQQMFEQRKQMTAKPAPDPSQN